MNVTERGDALAGRGTPYSLDPGFLFRGGVDFRRDVDWIEVDLARGETYAFAAFGTGGSALRDPLLALYNANGLRLASDDDSGPGARPFLTYTADEGGTHYVAAQSASRFDTGDYSLRFATALTEVIDADGLYRMDVGDAFTGFIAPRDTDSVTVDLAAGETVRISAEVIGRSDLDPLLEVVDQSNAGVIAISDDDGGAGFNSLITFTPRTDGPYEITVDGFQSTSGSYRLTVGSPTDEADDAPASTATQYRIQPGQIFTGDLFDPAGNDVDWIGIRMTGGVTYTLSLSGDGTSQSLNDTILEVHDASGTRLARDDDGGFGASSYLEFTPNRTGTYYLGASEFLPDGGGTYELAATVGAGQGSARSDILLGDGGANTVFLLGGNDVYDGGRGDDSIFGGPDDDTLVGGGGADFLDGGTGVDTLDFRDATGRVFADIDVDQRGRGFLRFYDEGQPEGDTYANFENVEGGRFADNLRGDDGANLLGGGGVSDRLYGRAGDDALLGGTGADAIYGGLGVDVMIGGSDAGRSDRFIYFGNAESGVGRGNRDVITDFTSREDRIELGRLDADVTRGLNQAFDFIGRSGFSGRAGELGYVISGGDTIVRADTDGDRRADFEIQLTGSTTLTAGDFIL